MLQSFWIQVLRDKASQGVHRLVGSVPKVTLGWQTLLGIVLIALSSTVKELSIEATLSGLGIELGSVMIWEFLKRYLHRGEPTLADAIDAINQMGQAEQDELERLSQQVDLLPILLQALLEQQNAELLDQFGRFLEQWGDRVGLNTMNSLLLEIRQHTARIGPLETELAELRIQIEALAAKLQEEAYPSRRARRTGRVRGDSMTDKLSARLDQQLRDEFDSLL